MQEWITIGTVDVPTILDKGGERYYPIRYVSEKVLLRSGSIINKYNKEQYKQYIIKFIIDYGEYHEQETNCISKTGLKLLLGKTHIGRLSVNQRKSQNELHKLLNLPLLTESKTHINYLSKDNLSQHDKYTIEIIKMDIAEHERRGDKLTFRLCSKCNKYHPLTTRYYSPDARASNGFIKLCKKCTGKVDEFEHVDLVANEMRKKGGNELLNAYKNNSIIPIYESYLNGVLSNLPDCYINKDDYLELIKYLYHKGKIDKDTLTWGNIKRVSKLKKVDNILTIHEIYTYLFGEDYYLYPWRYDKFRFKDELELTWKLAFRVFDNYLKQFNLDISDPLLIDYEKYIKKAKLSKFVGDILEFAVKFNEYRYAGYMFKTKGVNYYKNEDNLLFDLKYLVEQDMKIDIEKIPLYITKSVLLKKAKSVHYHIVTKSNGSIYHWFDMLYPDRFIETDFDINAYRLEFDSDTESFIHDILKDKFKNRLIYNQRNGDREIRLNGMSPDWFVFTDDGVWIIEYYGMWNWKNRKNDRIRRYMRKTIDKMRRYREIDGYHILNLYNEDIEDDYKGVVEKIKMIDDIME